ncbi:hypothetical protein EBZ39_14865 [bacterium]|nr:hypothetical protein [bacterium]
MNQASAGRKSISEGFARLLSRLKLEAQHTDLALIIVEAQIKNQAVPAQIQDAFDRLDARLKALDFLDTE